MLKCIFQSCVILRLWCCVASSRYLAHIWADRSAWQCQISGLLMDRTSFKVVGGENFAIIVHFQTGSWNRKGRTNLLRAFRFKVFAPENSRNYSDRSLLMMIVNSALEPRPLVGRDLENWGTFKFFFFCCCYLKCIKKYVFFLFNYVWIKSSKK